MFSEKLCHPFLFWFGVLSAGKTKFCLIWILDLILGNGRVFGVAKILVDEDGLFVCALVGRLEYVSVNRVEIMKWINDFWKPILGMGRRSLF